jgi:hypothetical protein
MKKIIVSIFISIQAFGCVCEPNIAAAFNAVEKEVIANNLSIVNSNLDAYNANIRKNTELLKAQTDEYRQLMSNEAAIALELKKVLFEIQKAIEAQSVKNRALSQDVQGVFKQNEHLIIMRQKILEKWTR